MRGISRVLALLLLVSGLASAQGVPGALAPCKMDGSDCAPATGTVTTTGTLASGRVALGSGATSITGDAGLTGVGTGTGFKLGIGTDIFLSRASAGTLLVEDGSGNPRDVQARSVKGADGTFNAPSFSFSNATGHGLFYAPILGELGFSAGGGQGDASLSYFQFRVGSTASLGFSSSNQAHTAQADALFSRGGAAIIQLGYVNDASPVAQTLQAQGSRGGTDTNVAGGNLTIRPGAGTGSATGSSIVFQTPTAGASGTTAQTQATRLTLSEPAVIAAIPVRLAGYTVATLPAGTVGDTAYVTDATAPTYLGTLTGGGAVTCPVMYNGAAWVSH